MPIEVPATLFLIQQHTDCTRGGEVVYCKRSRSINTMHISPLKSRFAAVIFSAALLMSLVPARQTLAVTANIYLSPATQTVTKGTIFTVAVGISTASEITEADVYLTYPSNQILFQDVSYSGSAFSNKMAWSGGGGNIHIKRTSDAAASGELPLAVLTFTVTAEYGTGTMSVQSNSTLKNTDAPVAATYGSAALDFGAKAPPVAAPQKPPTTYTILASPRDFDGAAPILSNIQSIQTGANAVSVSWTTNEPSTSMVEYGLDTSYGLSAAENTRSTSHSVALKTPFLLPNSLFHYRVISADSSGNTVRSTDLVFTTKSVQYALTVHGSNGKPLPNASVTLNGQTAQTDGSGKAVLSTNTGNQALNVSYDNVTLLKNVNIGPDKLVQTDSVQLAASQVLIDGRYIVYPFLVGAGLLVGLASRSYLLKYPLLVLRRKKNKFLSMTISSMQREYGDKNPAHNPYQVRSIFSFWGVWNSFVDVFGRPSKKLSKKIRAEVKASKTPEKPAPQTTKHQDSPGE